MTDFHGVPVPPGLPAQHQVFLEKIVEYLSRVDRGSSGGGTSLAGGKSGKASPAGIIQRTITTSSQVTSIPIEAEGTILQLRFTASPTVVGSGNLRLVSDYVPFHPNERLTLISTGGEWWEISRGSAGATTFIPAALFSAVPDTGVDQSGNVQDAFDNVPDGSTLYFSPGTYTFEAMPSVDRSNLTIWLDPGAVFLQTDGQAALDVSGVTPDAISTAFTANVVAGQQDAIPVTDSTDFTVGNWVLIEDTQTVSGSSGHKEINRIRAKGVGTISLYYPTIDGYLTANLAGITEFQPVENVHITGGGTFQNSTTSPEGDGIRMTYAVNCSINGVNVNNHRAQGIKLESCRGVSIEDVNIGDAAAFSGSRGYGIAVTSCQHTRLSNCMAYRTRHAYDISFWSRDTTLDSCKSFAGAFSSFKCHAGTRGTYFNNCTAFGVRGFDSGSPSTEMGTSNTAVGFDVDAYNEDIVFDGCTAAYTSLSGFQVIFQGCKDIRILNCLAVGCNYRGLNTGAGFRTAPTNGSSALLPGLIIRGNTAYNCYTVGIYCGFNDATIDGNLIYDTIEGTDARNTLASSGAAGTSYGIIVSSTQHSTPLSVFNLSGVQVTNNTIMAVSEPTHFGIYLGGLFGYTANPTAPVSFSVANTTIRRNFVFGMNRSGIIAMPEQTTISGNTITLSLSGYDIDDNIISNCNGSDSDSYAGITATEQGTLGVSHGVVNIRRNNLTTNYRYGIRAGVNTLTVSDNWVYGTTNGGGTVGIGIWIRSEVAAHDINLPVISGNRCWSNTQDGIRISHTTTVGSVVRAVVSKNLCWSNGDNGIMERTLSSKCQFLDNDCWNNDTNAAGWSGLRIEGDDSVLVMNKCFDTQASATQQFGIDVSSDSSGAVLTANWCSGNASTTHQIRISGTGVEMHEPWKRQATVADAAHTILIPWTSVRYSSLSAARVVTMPSANAVGLEVEVYDGSGSCSATNTLTLTRAGSDVFDDGSGATTYELNDAFASARVRCVASGRWKVMTASSAASTGYCEPLTNGDAASPELIFADGDVVMVLVP